MGGSVAHLIVDVSVFQIVLSKHKRSLHPTNRLREGDETLPHQKNVFDSTHVPRAAFQTNFLGKNQAVN